ncbi:MAG: NADPH-dependent FMN reductase [Vicingaceae bacterium]
MITIISASNRKGNLTALFAEKCKQFLEQKEQRVQLFYLNQLPADLSLQSVYEYDTSVFNDWSEKLIQPAEKLLFVVPEYNGSIPGILKLFLDGISPKDFKGKKSALIGVSAGRAGNLRGMDHLTDILHYLEVEVLPTKLPISKLYDLLEEGEVKDKETLVLLEAQVQKLIDY